MVMLFFYPSLMFLPLLGGAGRREEGWRVVAGDQADGPPLLWSLTTITMPPPLLTGPSGHLSLLKVRRSSGGPRGVHAPAVAALTMSLPIQVL